MSAGRGVQHSEFNPSEDKPAHFLQIWIMPDQRGVTPSYEQKHFAAEEKRGKLRLIASRDGADGSVRIHQDAKVYAGLFDGNEQAEFAIAANRQVYVHVARGSITVNGNVLSAGDAIGVSDIDSLSLTKGQSAEV
jgi:redox-sensitive bicupin YhaK (pirin superfamily)